MLLQGLYRLDNRNCDDALRQAFKTGNMSRSFENIVPQLIYFSNLLENHKGLNTQTDTQICQRLIKELKGLSERELNQIYNDRI